MNQLTEADFAHFAITKAPSSYRLDYFSSDQLINEYFWFLELRNSTEAIGRKFFTLTKMKLLLVTEPESSKRDTGKSIDTTRFINGKWNRQIYHFNTVNGFGNCITELANYIFRTHEDAANFAMYYKLLYGEIKMIDLSEAIADADEPVVKRIPDKPVFWPFDFPIPKGTRFTYVAELARQYNWTHGVDVGIGQGLFSTRMLQMVPTLSIVGVDPYEILYDKFGFRHSGTSNFSVLRHSKAIIYNLIAVDKYNGRLQLIEKQSLDAIADFRDNSLDFIYLDGSEGNKWLQQDILQWMPKIKKGGFIIGVNCNNSNTQSLLDQVLPTWQPGHDQIWIAQIE